jgi:hypothetical protein
MKIEVGRKVSSSLYNRGMGVICAVNGVPGVVPVRSLGGGIVQAGGSCEVDIAFYCGSMAKRLPECILMGVQWELQDEVVDAAEVAAVLAKAVLQQAALKAKADEVAAAFVVAMGQAEKDGIALGLIPEGVFNKSGKRGSAAAFNLRAELKAAGIKAKVKQDGYSALNVWAVDMEAAQKIASKYKAGGFDSMSDCYDYDPSAWGKVFGDVQYVFVYKEPA